MKKRFITVPKMNTARAVDTIIALEMTNRRVILPRLGMSVTTQGGSGRQCVTGTGRNLSNYRFVLLNVYHFGRLKTQ